MGQHYPVKIHAPLSKCTALKYTSENYAIWNTTTFSTIRLCNRYKQRGRTLCSTEPQKCPRAAFFSGKRAESPFLHLTLAFVWKPGRIRMRLIRHSICAWHLKRPCPVLVKRNAKPSGIEGRKVCLYLFLFVIVSSPRDRRD